MISKVAVFHRGGAVLWRSDDENETQTPTAGGDNNNNNDPYLSINKLIQTVLLSDKTASDHMIYDSFTLKWTFANDLDLIFIAVYFSFTKLLHVDKFLKFVKDAFIKMYAKVLKGGIMNLSPQNYSKFYDEYKKIQKEFQTHISQKPPKRFPDTKIGKQHRTYSRNNNQTSKPKRKKPKPKRPSYSTLYNPNDSENINLDFSEHVDNNDRKEPTVAQINNIYASSSDEFSDEIDDGITSGIWNKFSSLVTNKPLKECDILCVLSELELKLSSKNVANSIAKELCDSLKQQLIGKKIGTFNTIKSVVKQSIKDAFERILKPDMDINILHGIHKAKQENRPYVIVFIGVNGVGKSTSLSKLIYYLKSRNLKVSVAACDTFRSGAVEQLKTHCKALKVRLFNQGYARDASSVAYRAIQEATNKYNDDVILIDTAGRMQNNAPLMKSLVSLITRNKPDLILFVGEALVGNDGVDQLLEFNKALKINQNKHLIDAIILTKFDTVDDKVGAAISMTYKSRKPIIFIGTGQHYPDLKRMHVKTLINKLLK
eukprot:108825_1